ncbi:hypothetical protein HPB47_018092, partial [Ixodes persulcatus]
MAPLVSVSNVVKTRDTLEIEEAKERLLYLKELEGKGLCCFVFDPWKSLFFTYLEASGANNFTSQRWTAILLHSLGVEGQRKVGNSPASPTSRAPLPLDESGDQSNGTSTGGKSPPGDDAFELKLATCDLLFSTATNVL